MDHGVQFKIGNVKKHSSINWGMLFSPFDIPSAKVRTHYEKVEGASGSVDMTEIFGIQYDDLKFSLKFSLPRCNYNERLREIKAFLHGRVAEITIYNDVEYYYLGRCELNDLKQNKGIGQVVIDVTAKPFKFKQEVTTITETIKGTKTVTFINDSMEVVPSFKCSADMTLEFNGNKYAVGIAKTKVADIIFSYGENVIKFTGTGTVEVTYQEGAI